MTTPAVAPRGDLTDWRQGSLVGNAVRDVLCLEERRHVGDLDWSRVTLVLVSQDCDICADEGIEPYVDALPFVPLQPEAADRDAQCRGGRNPRRLVLDLPGRSPAATEQWRRLRISKAALRGHLPMGQIATDDATCLRRWLGRRYTRAAFPDAFNDRLNANKRIRKKLEDLWAGTNAKAISGIYIRFVDQDEQPGDREISNSDEHDHIVVRVTYPVTSDPATGTVIVDPTTKAAAEQVLEELDTLITGVEATDDKDAIKGVDGIEMDDGKAVPETDFTLHDLRSYLRFDRDFRSNDAASIVPLAADAP